MNVTQNLQKWGNSAGVRLPQGVIKAARLSLNQPLVITVKEGSVVLTPVKTQKKPTLDELLEGLTPELTAEDQAWLNMKPVGKEIINDDYSVSAK